MDQVLGPPRAALPPPPERVAAVEKHVEDVHGRVEAAAAAAAPLLDRLLAPLVVDLALVGVGQNLDEGIKSIHRSTEGLKVRPNENEER